MARTRRRAGRSQRREASKPRERSLRRRWRDTIESFGGFTVLGAIVATVLVVIVLVVQNPLGLGVSDAPLRGDPASDGPSTHIADGDGVGGGPLPPASGAHAVEPQRVGSYEDPIPEANAVHALEHGIVWIAYQPVLLSADQIGQLNALRSEFERDVIVSPRPANADAVVVVSWGRRQIFDAVDLEALRDFITANRNRAPEPGIR